MREKDFESAASSFKAGLNRNQQRDQTLNDLAEFSGVIAASLSKTQPANVKGLLQEAEALVEDDDTLTQQSLRSRLDLPYDQL